MYRFCLETLLKIQRKVAPPKWKIKACDHNILKMMTCVNVLQDYYKSIAADYAALKGMTSKWISILIIHSCMHVRV